MPKITNKLYKQFLNPEEWIETITPEEFKENYEKIKYKNKHKTSQAKGIAALLYWTGRRPEEIMRLTPKHLKKQRTYLIIRTPTMKKGISTQVMIKFNTELKELYEYAIKGIPSTPIFYHFLPKEIQFNKVSWIDKKTKEKKIKLYERTASNIYYLMITWFFYPGYLLRHNRFTRMAEKGASINQILQFKGGKSMRSVESYIKYTKTEAKKISRFID